jgi:urea transport system permease protein
MRKPLEVFLLASIGALLLAAPALLSDFRLNLLGKFLAFAIVALGIDLIWGYAGIFSLGHGVFFGIGGYSMAMYLKLQAAGDSLPDFMTWNGLTSLPWFWSPMRHFWVAALCAVFLPAVVAAIVGFLTFRSRVRGVYFSILTQAMAVVAGLVLVGQQPYTGGTNGITDFDTIAGFPLDDPATQRTLYVVTVLFLGAAYVLCRRLVRSRFGRLLAAIRDGENRLRFLGYDPVSYKVGVFAASAALAGLAGALFVPQVGIISPSSVGVVPSIEMVIWAAVGGRGTLWGAILGAAAVNCARTAFSESFPAAWVYLYGLLFVGVVMLFPSGLAGGLRSLSAGLRRSPARAKPERKPLQPALEEVCE